MNSTLLPSSSAYDFVTASKQPAAYALAVTVTLVVITNILNVCVLSRRTLRSSPCAHYFLASVPPTLLYAVVSPLNMILQAVHGIYIFNSVALCKLTGLTIFGTPFLYALMLVCASIDRFCASSSSMRLRQFSDVRVARRVIVIACTLTTIYMTPFIFIYYYNSDSPNINKCSQYATILTSIYLISRVVIYYILIPVILGVFGILTIHNIRTRTRRVAPTNQTNARRRTEGQLARMLIIQLAVYLLFFVPAGITYVLTTLVPSMNTPYYGAIRLVTVVWQQGGYFIAFFFYVLSGKVYREEIVKMFHCY